MTAAPKSTKPGQRPKYFLLFLLAAFVLAFLFAIGPAVFVAGLAVAVVGVLLCLLSEFAGPAPTANRRRRRTWRIEGPSPVRQELVLTGTGRCTLRFWFREHQSMDYRYDLIDGEGNDVPETPCNPQGTGAHPGRLCWRGDEGGPGGDVYLVDHPHWWKLTIRYQMRATHDKVVRGAELHVEVDPKETDVAFPEAPTPLPTPVVTWGRLNDPPDRLKSASRGA